MEEDMEGKNLIMIKILRTGRKVFQIVLCVLSLGGAKGMDVDYEAEYWIEQEWEFTGSAQNWENNFPGSSCVDVERRSV